MNIGMELEFTGITQETVANKLCDLWRTEGYDINHITKSNELRPRYSIMDDLNRTWYLTYDKSIKPIGMPEAAEEIESIQYKCELISPVMDSKELERMYQALEVINASGGMVNETCGIHIHVDMLENVAWLNYMIQKIFYHQEAIVKHWGVPIYRTEKYCKCFSEKIIQSFENLQPFDSCDAILDFFYERLANGVNRDDDKNPLRYYLLNLNSIHKHNTLEFRFFNSTLSTKILREYISWIELFAM